MASGITREIDNLGRVVIPIEWRKELGLKVKDSVEIIKNGNEIIIKKYEQSCYCCKEYKENLVEFKGIKICKSCLDKVNELSKIILNERL